MRHRSRKNHPPGFTLFEILVAISILGVSIAVVFELYAANLRALSLSEGYISASMRGETKMREVLLRDDIGEGTWREEGADGYRFEISVVEVLPERTENLQVKLLHVDLSVFYRAGAKEKSIRLDTLKVVEKET